MILGAFLEVILYFEYILHKKYWLYLQPYCPNIPFIKDLVDWKSSRFRASRQRFLRHHHHRHHNDQRRFLVVHDDRWRQLDDVFEQFYQLSVEGEPHGHHHDHRHRHHHGHHGDRHHHDHRRLLVESLVSTDCDWLLQLKDKEKNKF